MVCPPGPPKVRWCRFFRLEKAVFRCFFNPFSRPTTFAHNMSHIFGKPICISGQFRISGNIFSASYEASEFCRQIVPCPPQYLKPYYVDIKRPLSNVHSGGVQWSAKHAGEMEDFQQFWKRTDWGESNALGEPTNGKFWYLYCRIVFWPHQLQQRPYRSTLSFSDKSQVGR